MNTKKGFTFIEILVVIAIVAILAAIVALILNPAEYLRRARDAQRLGDASRINTAMALYSFGTASRPIDQDPDGPQFPLLGSPPITDSCINDPVPHRLFVSVPLDNGEASPTPPTDWVYSRVTSTELRAINGKGWLPVDFTVAPSGQAPFSVLPVDPVNTFASGYYYSYGCGSWNMNMNFESEKYRTLYESTDQGRFDNVYEIGSDLAVLPVQIAYGPTSTSANETPVESASPAVTPTPTILPGTLTLNPILGATTTSGSWSVIGSYPDYAAVSDPLDTTYISNNSNNSNGSFYTFSLPTFVATGTINAARIKITASQPGSIPREYYLKPVLWKGGSILDNSSYSSIQPVYGTNVGEQGLAIPGLTWGQLSGAQLGIHIYLSPTSGSGKSVRVSKIYLEIDYY